MAYKHVSVGDLKIFIRHPCGYGDCDDSGDFMGDSIGLCGILIATHAGEGVRPHGKLRQVPGKVRMALAFDPGVALRLGEPERWNMGETDDFSVAFWVRLPADWKEDPVFLSNKDWSNGDNPGFAIAAQNGRRHWQWNAKGTVGSRVDFDPGGSPLSPGEWHHLAVTHHRGGDANFYLQGIEVGRKSLAERGSFDTESSWWIGQDGTGGFRWEVPWELDEFQIHRRVLDPGEVLGLVTGN